MKRRSRALPGAAVEPDTVAAIPTPRQYGNRGKGRPKGAKNKTTVLRENLHLLRRKQADDLIIDVLPKVVEAVARKAIDGDMQAAKLILDRAIPVHKPISNSSAQERGAINIIVNTATPERLANSVTLEGVNDENV